MGRRPATFSQDDVRRAIKAVEAAGLTIGAVEIAPDGSIRIVRADAEPSTRPPVDRRVRKAFHLMAMPRPRKPYVQRETSRHGKTVWYFRRGDGPRVRLPGAYESPEWLSAYERALAQGAPEPKASKPATGTIRWLVDEYRKSAGFRTLGPSTRRVRERLLERLIDENGDVYLEDVDRKALEEARDRRARGGEAPEAGNAFMKLMRVLLDFAIERGTIDHNPADKVKNLKSNPDGFHTWTLEEVERFEARHPVGTMARLALDVLLYTGVRRQDAVRLGRQHIRGGVVTIRRRRRAGRRTSSSRCRCSSRSPGASPRRRRAGEMTLIVTHFGRPFSDAGFGNWFRARCDEAGVPGSAHGLRKASATRAAEAGATTTELMAMFGWTTAKEAERYNAGGGA